jgi:hypothetical protein
MVLNGPDYNKSCRLPKGGPQGASSVGLFEQALAKLQLVSHFTELITGK